MGFRDTNSTVGAASPMVWMVSDTAMTSHPYQLSTLGSFAFYRAELTKRGFREVGIEDLTHQLRAHYDRVGRELKSNYDEAVRLSGQTYVDNMIKGLQHWVDGADRGYLAWGIMDFRLEG